MSSARSAGDVGFNSGDTDLNRNCHGIAFDGAGSIYVADPLNDRVQKFDSSGNYMTE